SNTSAPSAPAHVVDYHHVYASDFKSSFFQALGDARHLHSFPTRRSSDLVPDFPEPGVVFTDLTPVFADGPALRAIMRAMAAPVKDRKSTRLNSSHVSISYAGFCLKKKNRK